MKKFNHKNKREYLNKTRNTEKKSNEPSSLSAKKNLGSNWKNYEEVDDDDDVASNLNKINAETENFNFDELLESSSEFKKNIPKT